MSYAIHHESPRICVTENSDGVRAAQGLPP
jgi:hypothetical protein